jgi:hypothetical protein
VVVSRVHEFVEVSSHCDVRRLTTFYNVSHPDVIAVQARVPPAGVLALSRTTVMTDIEKEPTDVCVDERPDERVCVRITH